MNKIIIFLISLKFIKSLNTTPMKIPKEGEDYPSIACGKPNPKRPEDCYKYGTDSGMLCCWVSDENKKDGNCVLIYDELAEQKFQIDGELIFESEPKESKKRYWNCGNKSNYFNINIILIFICYYFLFLNF